MIGVTLATSSEAGRRHSFLGPATACVRVSQFRAPFGLLEGSKSWVEMSRYDANPGNNVVIDCSAFVSHRLSQMKALTASGDNPVPKVFEVTGGKMCGRKSVICERGLGVTPRNARLQAHLEICMWDFERTLQAWDDERGFPIKTFSSNSKASVRFWSLTGCRD